MQLKINGREVNVHPGTTVKDAARLAAIKIPGLCDHPELEPYGGCRLCIVEIEGIRGYPSSCTLPVSEGMVVRTDTPALQDLRMNVLQLLLSEHPCTCLTCERAGKCDDVREGMRKVPWTTGCRYCLKDQRCELQEIVESIGLKKMELSAIGSKKEIVRSPFFDRNPNLCILCGRCVRACEQRGWGVIAFTFRGFDTGIGTAFEKPLEEIGCRFCGACVDVCPTGALAERRSRWSGPADQIVKTTCPYCSANCQIGLEVKRGEFIRARPEGSKLCVRGRFGLEFLYNNRLKRPLVRNQDRLVEVSWEEALDFAANGLAKYSDKDFALFTSGVLTNEALYIMKKFAHEVMKSEAVAADVSTSYKLEDLKRGPLIIAGDLADTNPALELALRPYRPVVISHLRTFLARESSLWLRTRPGEEATALVAIASSLSKGNNVDLNVLNRAGVSLDEIQEAAKFLKGAMVLIGPDCSEAVVEAAYKLALAADGKLCLPGKNCNSHGASALELNCNYDKMVQNLLLGKMKAAYIAGSNPVRESPLMAEALSSLEFLVVQDLFLTETAELADVVLPSASFAEIEGTFASSDLNMLEVNQAIPSIGKPDWKIVVELGRRIGALGFEFSNPEEVRKGMPAFSIREKSPKNSKLPEAIAEDPINFQLIEGPNIFEFNSGTRTSRVFDLQYLTRDRLVEIHPQDARKMGIFGGTCVCLEFGGNRVDAVARISSRVAPGILRISGKENKVVASEVRLIV